jgi:hypothetical protein
MTAAENVSTGSERSAGVGGGCALGTRASPLDALIEEAVP